MPDRPRFPESLQSGVLRFIHRKNLISGDGPLVVAVSGGPDSVCLLHVLVSLKSELGIELHAAHLNHGLRGAGSEADALYVADLCRSLAIPVTVGSGDVKGYRDKHRVPLEEAAREVRYAFLAEVSRSAGARAVAVGHTQDDHVETILMHLLRGAGTRGLRGLLPIVELALGEPPAPTPPKTLTSPGSSVTVVRPLLEITREETARYCHSHGLRPRFDETNESMALLRNRVRLELIPLLKRYNPEVTGTLLRTARIAADDLAFLDESVKQLWDSTVDIQGRTIALDKGGFLALPPALQRHLLRKVFEELAGSLRDVETRHIEGILGALHKPAGRSVSLPGGLVFTVEYSRYLLGPEPAALCPFPVLDGEYPLSVPGETLIAGWKVTATLSSPAAEDCMRTSPLPVQKHDTDLTASFDFDKVGARLNIRPPKPGDRFQPLGLGQTKKVAEFMLDEHIPRWWRGRVPILASPQHIIWVAGWRIDERVKITRNTGRVLSLELKGI